MDPAHLHPAELEYELNVRDVFPVETVNFRAKEALLRKKMLAEARGEHPPPLLSVFDPRTELEACLKTIEDIKSKLSPMYSGVSIPSELLSRALHVDGRLRRIQCGTSVMGENRQNLIVEATRLARRLETLNTEFIRSGIGLGKRLNRGVENSRASTSAVNESRMVGGEDLRRNPNISDPIGMSRNGDQLDRGVPGFANRSVRPIVEGPIDIDERTRALGAIPVSENSILLHPSSQLRAQSTPLTSSNSLQIRTSSGDAHIMDVPDIDSNRRENGGGNSRDPSGEANESAEEVSVNDHVQLENARVQNRLATGQGGIDNRNENGNLGRQPINEGYVAGTGHAWPSENHDLSRRDYVNESLLAHASNGRHDLSSPENLCTTDLRRNQNIYLDSSYPRMNQLSQRTEQRAGESRYERPQFIHTQSEPYPRSNNLPSSDRYMTGERFLFSQFNDENVPSSRRLSPPPSRLPRPVNYPNHRPSQTLGDGHVRTPFAELQIRNDFERPTEVVRNRETYALNAHEPPIMSTTDGSSVARPIPLQGGQPIGSSRSNPSEFIREHNDGPTRETVSQQQCRSVFTNPINRLERCPPFSLQAVRDQNDMMGASSLQCARAEFRNEPRGENVGLSRQVGFGLDTGGGPRQSNSPFPRLPARDAYRYEVGPIGGSNNDQYERYVEPGPRRSVTRSVRWADDRYDEFERYRAPEGPDSRYHHGSIARPLDNFGVVRQGSSSIYHDRHPWQHERHRGSYDNLCGVEYLRENENRYQLENRNRHDRFRNEDDPLSAAMHYRPSGEMSRPYTSRLVEYEDEADDGYYSRGNTLRGRMGNYVNPRVAYPNRPVERYDGPVWAPSWQNGGARRPSGGHYRSGVPVARWKILYSGDAPAKPNEVNIHDFLDLCRMYSLSENVSEETLLQQIVHLLTGRARAWFQSVYREIYTWGEFEKAVKDKFLPDDYNFWLLSDIENRRQKKNEPVGTYINDMIMKYRAMPLPVPDQQKIYTIRKNLLPHFINCLAAVKISTLVELEEVCKRVESTQALGRLKPAEPLPFARTGRPPLRPRYVDEIDYEDSEYEIESDSEAGGDIAAIGAERRVKDRKRFKRDKPRMGARKPSALSDKREEETDELGCFNCLRHGHLFKDCPEDRNGIFCYRCGRRDVRAADAHQCPKNLPRCSEKSEQPASNQ